MGDALPHPVVASHPHHGRYLRAVLARHGSPAGTDDDELNEYEASARRLRGWGQARVGKGG